MEIVTSKQIKSESPKSSEFPEHLFGHLAVDYSRVYTSLKIFWGSKEFTDYVEKVLIQGPGENRKGFSPEMFSLLTTLQCLHDNLFPSAANTRNKESWHFTE